MAASFIQRWAFSEAEGFAQGPINYHTAEKLYVIDWITVMLESTTGGDASFEITDSTDTGAVILTGIVWRVTLPLAAGDSDTIHVTFPGGFPLKKVSDISAAINSNSLDGAAILRTAIGWAMGGAATDAHVWIGYHMERESNRR